MRFMLYSSLLVVISLTLFSLVAARDTLTPSQPLRNNETLISSDGRFVLGFFTPSDSVNRSYVGLWYKNVTVQTVVWVANRQDPVTNSTGTLSITAGGKLTITNQYSVVVWSTLTGGLTRPAAQLLNDGNFVVKQDGDEINGRYAWQGFDYPTDTLLPGMKLGFDLINRHNYTLTAWKSHDDPSPGKYDFGLDVQGDPRMYLFDGPFTKWRSGPWNGIQFIGNPDGSTSNGSFVYNYVDNSNTVVYMIEQHDQSFISRLVVNQSGVVQRLIWIEGFNQWNVLWVLPADLCDQYGECGPYGVCDANNYIICSCLPGFTVLDSATQDNKDKMVGCTRKTTLDCSGDGFIVVSEVKLPDTTNSTVYLSLSLDECGAVCLRNCSCTAYATADVTGNGKGCVIWTSELIDIRLSTLAGQDLYIRVSATDIDVAHSHKIGIMMAITGSLISVLLLLACIGSILWKIKKQKGLAPANYYSRTMFEDIKNLLSEALLATCICCFVCKRKKRSGDKLNQEAEENDLDLPLFGFGTIATATDSFSLENKLGEGGFGPVYKGHLGESQEIAVKRLAKTSQQGSDEFKNEVMLIAKLQHRNLVRLLGCCAHEEERMLIYEYMPNKSLDAFLFDKEKCGLLDWNTRYQIITGITRGLLYLHHDSRFRIIHRDLKASNILLDNEMNPKISDFGMARIFGGDQTDFNTRKVVGTYGYMLPEYAMEGKFSMKSDVFSFGVLVLEIISGRRNRGPYTFSLHLNLVAHVWSLWNESKSLQIVHESMNDDAFAADEVLKCIKVALLCVQERPEDRPLISSVVVMLSSASDVASLPHPKQPGFIACTSPPEEPKQDSSSSNGLTVSLHGR